MADRASSTVTSGTPLVSVVMSVHSGRDMLLRAVRSILWQTYPRWELILMDDGSSDGTAEVARALQDPRIRVFRDGVCRGLAVRLNQGIEQARGAYVARMDADDVAFPERFARQVEFLEAHPDVDLLATSALLVDADDRIVGMLAAGIAHDDICRDPWRGFPMPHPTWMGRAHWFRRNPYDSAARKGQDQALLFRTFRHSRFAGLPDALLGYRYARLSMRKSLVGRFHFVRSVWTHGRASDAFRAGGTHAAAATRDLLALATGAGERVIRRRVRPAPESAASAWQSCVACLAGKDFTAEGTRSCAALPD